MAFCSLASNLAATTQIVSQLNLDLTVASYNNDVYLTFGSLRLLVPKTPHGMKHFFSDIIFLLNSFYFQNTIHLELNILALVQFIYIYCPIT